MSLAAKIHLAPEEEIIEAIHRSTLVDLWQYVFGLGLTITGAFFLPWLLQQAPWGEAVFGVGLILGAFIIIRAWYFHQANILVITSERVVDISRLSWFDETMSSVGYPDLKEVFVHRRGLLAGLFNYGNVIIATKNQQSVLEIESVRQPQAVQSLIHTESDAYRQRRRVVDTVSIYKNFIKILPALSEAQLCEARDLIDTQLDVLDAAIVPVEEIENQDDGVV